MGAFDSECFELGSLELNGLDVPVLGVTSTFGSTGSSFVQNPSVFLEIMFRPVNPVP